MACFIYAYFAAFRSSNDAGIYYPITDGYTEEFTSSMNSL